MLAIRIGGGGGIYCLAGLITGKRTHALGVCAAVFTSGYGDGILDKLLWKLLMLYGPTGIPIDVAKRFCDAVEGGT